MIERYFVKPSTVDRIRGCWLAPEIERYVEWMASHGYAVRNFYRRVPILCQFAEFAKLHGVPTSNRQHCTSRNSHYIGWPAMDRSVLCQQPNPRSPKRPGTRCGRCCDWRWRVASPPPARASRSHSGIRHQDFCSTSRKSAGCVRRRFINMSIA